MRPVYWFDVCAEVCDALKLIVNIERLCRIFKVTGAVKLDEVERPPRVGRTFRTSLSLRRY